MKLYAAYGSNLDCAAMKRRCPHARVFGTARLAGYALNFRLHPACNPDEQDAYLTIDVDFTSSVPLGIWEVDSSSERLLDDYEAYPALYYKTKLELSVTPLREITAKEDPCIETPQSHPTKQSSHKVFMYIMNEGGVLHAPSKTYFETCLAGYRDFAFNAQVLEDAYQRAIETSQQPIQDSNQSLVQRRAKDTT